jgi:hypothetical protein
MLDKHVLRVWKAMDWLRYLPVIEFCEYGFDFWGLTTCGLFDLLNNCQLCIDVVTCLLYKH